MVKLTGLSPLDETTSSPRANRYDCSGISRLPAMNASPELAVW
jgi:hypothetical protein